VVAEPLQQGAAVRHRARPEAAQTPRVVVVLQLRLAAAARLPPVEVPVRHPPVEVPVRHLPVALLQLPQPEVAAIAGQPRAVDRRRVVDRLQAAARQQVAARQQDQAVVIARLTVAIAKMKSRWSAADITAAFGSVQSVTTGAVGGTLTASVSAGSKLLSGSYGFVARRMVNPPRLAG
jgi:hypothetical protein